METERATRRRSWRRRWTDRVLADDVLFEQLQRVLRTSLEARQRMDRNLLRLYAALNVASYSDIARIDEEVAQLEEDVARLAGRLAVLRARLEASPRAEPS